MVGARIEDVPSDDGLRALALDDFLIASLALLEGARECFISAHGVHDVEEVGCVLFFHVPIIN